MTKDKRNFEKMDNDFSMEKILLFSIIMAASARRDYTRISIISPISILVDSQGVNIKEVAQVIFIVKMKILPSGLTRNIGYE